MDDDATEWLPALARRSCACGRPSSRGGTAARRRRGRRARRASRGCHGGCDRRRGRRRRRARRRAVRRAPRALVGATASARTTCSSAAGCSSRGSRSCRTGACSSSTSRRARPSGVRARDACTCTRPPRRATRASPGLDAAEAARLRDRLADARRGAGGRAVSEARRRRGRADSSRGVWHRLHPLSPFVRAGRAAIALAVVLVPALVSGRDFIGTLVDLGDPRGGRRCSASSRGSSRAGASRARTCGSRPA